MKTVDNYLTAESCREFHSVEYQNKREGADSVFVCRPLPSDDSNKIFYDPTIVVAPKKKSAKKRNKDKLQPNRFGLYQCHYCDLEMDYETVTADHKRSKSKGGGSTTRNLLPCCQPCNVKKGNMDYKEFIEKIIQPWEQK